MPPALHRPCRGRVVSQLDVFVCIAAPASSLYRPVSVAKANLLSHARDDSPISSGDGGHWFRERPSAPGTASIRWPGCSPCSRRATAPDSVAAFVHAPVVKAAQRDQVIELRFAAVGPVLDVVPIAVARAVAAREPATAVARFRLIASGMLRDFRPMSSGSPSSPSTGPSSASQKRSAYRVRSGRLPGQHLSIRACGPQLRVALTPCDHGLRYELPVWRLRRCFGSCSAA